MEYKEYSNKTYNLYTIKTDKFKTNHMEIVFRNNIVKSDITKRNMITEMLVENSKSFPTRRDMIIELENLYNSYFYGVNNRIGSSILTSFCFDFINPDLVGESIDKFIEFPFEVIFNPNVKNNEFDIITFNYIKNRIASDIDSIIEEPKRYSIQELLNIMCSETESSINLSGYKDDLKIITNSNLFDYYLNMIEHDYIDIYIIGDMDMDYVARIISNIFNVNILKNHKINFDVDNKLVKKPRKVIKNFNSGQENICVGLNLDNINEYEKNYIGYIYNLILGGGSLETKLYNRLRNENSLCYSASSIYQKFDKIIIIHTAISKENEEKAIKLIKESINDMIYNLTSEEIEDAKKLITTTLNMSLDNPGKIIDNYIYKNLYGLEDLEVRIENYNKISREDIINFAKKVKINTILCLRDGEDEEN